MNEALLRIRAAISALDEHFNQEDDVFGDSELHVEWLYDMAAGFEEMIDSAGLMFAYTEEQERLRELA